MRIVLKGIPPSLNQFAGRGNAWEYREQKKRWTTAVWAACRSSRERPKDPYERALVTVTYYFPTKARHDADNYCGKFLLDGLTKSGVIADDDLKHISVMIHGAYDKENPRTEIAVEAAKWEEKGK